MLIGESPDCENCTFPVCNILDSCTKTTKYAVGKWLGDGADFTIVDTPGLGDSDSDVNEIIGDILTSLIGVIEGANGIMLLVNGSGSMRLDPSLVQMLMEMQILFGNFWKNTIIGVSFWSYDVLSVAKRNHSGENEEWFLAEWNALLQEKLHLDIELQGVFIDAWSQQPWNVDDQDQQEAFERETTKLWEFSSQNEMFQFRTIEARDRKWDFKFSMH